LGEVDMIDHKAEREGTRESNPRRKLFCQKINHGNRENSEKKRDNTEVSFRICKWIKHMGENKE
jgi:hypothetical protein